MIGNQGSSRWNKKLLGALLITSLAIVSTVSFSYLVFSQPNPTDYAVVNSISSPSPSASDSQSTQTPKSPSPFPIAPPEPTPTSPSSNELNKLAYTSPSIPEFTVQYIDNSYDVPPTYGVDQFTGKTVITKEGYHVDNKSIMFTVKNQPFAPYNDSSGNSIDIYYNFRFKGSFGDVWSFYPFNLDGRSAIAYNGYSWGTGDLSPKISQSSMDYTTTSINLMILLSIASGYTGSVSYPAGGQIEFQAQALVGTIDCEPSGLLAGSYYTFTGETSGWSETQTITLP